MPSNITNVATSTNVFLYGATADATNTTSLNAPGELGMVFYNNNNRYQRVQLDSGATAATPTGIVAVNMLAFWVSKTQKVVTNDARFAGAGVPNSAGSTGVGARNLVAGVFRVAGTAGNYVDVLQKGDGISVANDNSGTVGCLMVADGTSATARTTTTAVGTAPPFQALGVARSTGAAGAISMDVDIASAD